jgi:hypothetical protein
MRAFLGGRSVPREEFAIAGIGEATGVPVVLLLDDGEAFVPEDYISLGYTNYEAWCVGAVGGRGGDASEFIQWRVSTAVETMSDSIWADVIAKANAGESGHVYSGSDRLGRSFPVANGLATATIQRPPVGVVTWDTSPIAGGGTWVIWQLTPEGLAWLFNPDHVAEVVSWLEPIVQPGAGFIGGGGGGGGLQVVQGFLEDLPASVIAAVGKKGADGDPGQAVQASPKDVSPAYDSRYAGMSLARWNFLNRFPNGHPTVSGPAEGSPGGASSFGDICKASGGKGGKPAIQWAGATRQQYANGGEGGLGGRVLAGGGAAGASTSASPGLDGGWDGSIGAGGGGGRGGSGATDGGRGSLSYADTSVYGARGNPGAYSAAIRNYARGTVEGPPDADVYIGALLSTTVTPIPTSVNPGSGGGARIPGSRKYGSLARGYNPDGAVLIRLTKVD